MQGLVCWHRRKAAQHRLCMQRACRPTHRAAGRPARPWPALQRLPYYRMPCTHCGGVGRDDEVGECVALGRGAQHAAQRSAARRPRFECRASPPPMQQARWTPPSALTCAVQHHAHTASLAASLASASRARAQPRGSAARRRRTSRAVLISRAEKATWVYLLYVLAVHKMLACW